MTIGLRTSVIIAVFLLIIVILNLIRKNRLNMKYALLWIILSAVLLLTALIPGLLDSLASFLGFEVTSNMVFFIAIFVVLIILLSLSMIVSEQSRKITLLIQELSLVKKQLREREKPDNE